MGVGLSEGVAGVALGPTGDAGWEISAPAIANAPTVSPSAMMSPAMPYAAILSVFFMTNTVANLCLRPG